MCYTKFRTLVRVGGRKSTNSMLRKNVKIVGGIT